MTIELAAQLLLEALLGFLVTYAISFLRTKAIEVKAKTDSAVAAKYIDMVVDTVTRCVMTTNQTYVNALKEQGIFTPEAQKIAFNRTYQMVLTVLSQEAKEYMINITGDFEAYLNELIESQVATEKNKGTR